MLAKQAVEGGEVFARFPVIVAKGVEGVSQQDHDELAPRGRKGRLEPRQLGRVHAPGHARVDGDQGKLRSLDLKERSVLEAAVGTPYSLRSKAALAMSSSMRASVVLVSRLSASTRACIAARAAAGVRNVAEALERVVPVVIAGDRVDRLIDPFEREPELRLVVIHGPRGVDHVRRDDDEAHGVLPRCGDELVAQDVLRGVSLAGIADDEEGKVAGIDPRRLQRRTRKPRPWPGPWPGRR